MTVFLQICGIVGAARRKALLIWYAAETVRSAIAPLASEGTRPADRMEALRLRLSLKGLELPDDGGLQVGHIGWIGPG